MRAKRRGFPNDSAKLAVMTSTDFTPRAAQSSITPSKASGGAVKMARFRRFRQGPRGRMSRKRGSISGTPGLAIIALTRERHLGISTFVSVHEPAGLGRVLKKG